MRTVRRRRAVTTAVVACLAVAAATAVAVRRSAADDDAPAAGGPGRTVDAIMAAVGRGQFDDAVGLMDGLKGRADQKDAARSALIAVREAGLGVWRGHDVSTVVRFSPRLQTVDVVGYFDVQPVLYRFSMYQPTDGGPWQVLDLKVDGNLTTATEALREDAAGVSLGRGGRATR